METKIEIRFKEMNIINFKAGELGIGNYFKFIEGIYVTIEVNKEQGYVDAIRLDKRESIVTELSIDTIIEPLLRIESL